MSFMLILEAVLIASSLSIDCFITSFAYGSDKIKIPFLSAQIINFTCSAILGISFLIGSFVSQYLPAWLTTAVCFSVLFILGIIKLLDGITKSIIRKYSSINKQIKFSLFNFKFILNLYANPEDADVDQSKTISPSEAVSLAVALSLDGMAVGFGAAMGEVNGIAVLIASLITGMIAILLGCYIGNKFSRKIKFNLSFFSGLILIALAIFKLF